VKIKSWPITNDGSALVVTVMTIVVLSLIAGTLIRYTSSKQAGPFQAASWHEAGAAAEGGVEIALNALRRSISEGDASAWSGWASNPNAGATAKKYITEDQLLSHTGEGNTVVRALVEISQPSGAGTINPVSISTNRYAYLIRSTGYARVPGPSRLAVKSDLALRKINVFTDMRTGSSTGGFPQITRVVEAVASPVSPFPAAMLSKESIEIKGGSGMIVDSYEPNLMPHKYDASKAFNDVNNPGAHRMNGTIATNQKKKDGNQDVIRVENANIYGNAAKGAGVVNIKGANAKVWGSIIDGFYRELKPVQSPRQSGTFSGASTLLVNRPKATINVMAGGTPGSSLYYKTDKIHLHDKDIINVKKNGSGGGTAEIWVTGDFIVHNGGRIQVEDGANLIIYAEKNITLQEKDKDHPAIDNNALARYVDSGNGNNYSTTDPNAVQIYGVVPTKDKKHVKIKTNMSGVIYAPDHEFEINLKTDRNFYGSVTGKKFKVTGGTKIHYDESLADRGKPFDYTLETWQEDWFDPNVRLTKAP